MAFILEDCVVEEGAEIDVRSGFIGPGSVIKKGAKIKGDHIEIGKESTIHEAEIIVKDLILGDRALIMPRVLIQGRNLKVGAEPLFDYGAVLGGGSCNDPDAFLRAGDFYHQGKNSQVNTGRGVTIGHEFGCGIDSKVFTHGAYLPAWEGFPVQWGPVNIGNRVWAPNAIVLPGTKIGDNVVVAAGSLVKGDLPSGCLAAGSPAEILKTDLYPQEMTDEKKRETFNELFYAIATRRAEDLEIAPQRFEELGPSSYKIGETTFNIDEREITGPATSFTEILRDQMRRNGVRFRYEVRGGNYVSFPETTWRD